MGLGPSRQNTYNSTWLEKEAQHKLKTTKSMSKVETICSIVPFMDEKPPLSRLMRRSDLDILFLLHCKSQNPPVGQSQALEMTNHMKAKELWRVLRCPSRDAPWDWNWQPPLSGDPSEIAYDFHTIVSRAVFRVPLSDFVKCALGHSTQAISVGALLSAVCDVRDSLQGSIHSLLETKKIYINVEKILRPRSHPLALWIVASSLDNASFPLENTLAPMLKPLRNLFATRDIDFVLNRLAVFDRRLAYINQKYDWYIWSADFDFLQCVYQALWSNRGVIPCMPPHIPQEYRNKKLEFLKGFGTVSDDEGYITSIWVLLFPRRLLRRHS